MKKAGYVRKIETLTKEQADRIPEFREKWLKIGLSTERANRSAAEQALKDAYKEGGLEPPRVMVWVDSPRGGLIAAKLVKEFFAKYPAEGGKNASEKVWGQVRDQVWDQVGGQVGDQVWDQVRGQVWDQVRGQVGGQVGDQVWDQVWGQVGENLSSLRPEWDDLWFWGQHDAGWLSFYDYFKEVCGLEDCKRLDPLMRLAQETGWVWMYRGFAILTERPTELHRNAAHRLHNETGPAVKYADGYAVYAVNGTRCPEKLIMTPRENLDVKEWLKCENVDHRRIAFQKIGIQRVIKELDAEVIDTYECKVGGKYELLMLDIGLSEKRPYLRMTNQSIGETHIEGVAPGTKTVGAALMWRNGFETKKYQAPAALT